MALTTAQKNELATRLIEAQQTNNYGSFNDLVRQLRLTQADFLENFPAINQAGINEQIGRGAVVPTTAPAAVTYTTPQVTNAIRDALNAGFTVQQARQGAMTNFGLSSADFDKALQQVQSTTYNTTFSDARVAQAIQDSLAQGFTLDQARQGALANYGVSDAQFNRALASVSGGAQGMRGSAPLYQFPGLLAGREDMATGAQRFLSRAPGSLLFDVPKVEGGQFTFTPGDFDYQAIREQQAGASQVDQAYLDQNQIQPGSAEYIRLTGQKPTGSATTTSTTGTTTDTTRKTTGTTTTGTTTDTGTGRTYTDAQVAQALQESMAQGFTLDQSLGGAASKYGISADQLARAQLLLPGASSKTITNVSNSFVNLTPAKQKLYDLLSTIGGEGRPEEVRNYVSSLNDAQALATLATRQGLSTYPSEELAFQAGRGDEPPPARVSAEYLRNFYQVPILDSPFEDLRTAPTGVAGLLNQQTKPTNQLASVVGNQVNTGLLAPQETYSSSQVAQAIIDSLGQGYTMDQIQQGAMNNFGLNIDQFNQATALLPSMGYTIGQGFAQR